MGKGRRITASYGWVFLRNVKIVRRITGRPRARQDVFCRRIASYTGAMQGAKSAVCFFQTSVGQHCNALILRRPEGKGQRWRVDQTCIGRTSDMPT
jgi:hypothetical protein